MAGIKVAIVALLLFACSSIPKPCDPELVASQQMIVAASCRSQAEETCPGYDSMTEEDKIKCPGVQECLDKIDRATEDCHGK